MIRGRSSSQIPIVLINWELLLIPHSRSRPVLSAFFTFLGASFRTLATHQLEILALRHQIGVLQRFRQAAQADRL